MYSLQVAAEEVVEDHPCLEEEGEEEAAAEASCSSESSARGYVRR